MIRFLTAAFLLASPWTSLAAAGGISWQATYEGALKLAAGEQKVVFIAVNMDGERANDRMAKEVYKDKAIVRLTEHTVNLVSSNFSHAEGDRKCPRFGGLTCTEHRRVDVEVRGKVLAPDDEGFVIAPQHVWLGPDGEVLLSVPYEVSVSELEWCFATALHLVDPELVLKISSGARAPKRLVMGGVADTGAAGGRGGAPPTRAEALELLDELKRSGGRGGGQQEKLRRLARADEPEARDYVLSVLRASAGGGRWGSGGGSNENGERTDRRATLLRWIGEASPQSYWEICVDFISAGEEGLRREAVVALEQLAAPESAKAIQAALGKEKDPAIKKNLFRALGTTGADNSRARKALLKQARDERKELWRLNAILALGSLAPHEEISERLLEILLEGEDRDRIAAAAAMALSRDPVWLGALEEVARESGLSPALEKAMGQAIGVLKGEPLGTLRATVSQVGSDEIERWRLFGGA